MITLFTRCGHYVVAGPHQSSFGSVAGQWQVRVSGPSITVRCGYKNLYSEPNRDAAILAVASFLEVDAACLVRPAARPDVLVGFNVMTSDWDDACSFSNQDHHCSVGHPCGIDHTQDSGHVVAVGYAVFRRISDDEYVSEDPQTIIVKLPSGEAVSQKAVDFHGYTDSACAAGVSFSAAIEPILRLLQRGADIVCHRIAHETLVICRELQKRSLESASPLLEALHSGHCTNRIAKLRNNGLFRSRHDEFRECFGREDCGLREHDPGHNAAKCARLYLYYNEALVLGSTEHTSKKQRLC